MRNLNTMYDIKDLRIVMIKKDFLESKNDDYINYFNDNVKFIVEKLVIEDKDKKGNPYYSEYYTECITEEDFSTRTSYEKLDDVPEMFSIVSRIPGKYFTNEEIASGKISTIRIFKILQDINMEKTIESNKVKKIGKKNQE